MAQTQELKPKTIRISDETMNAFRQVSSSIGANQDIALAKLLETYQIQQEKAVLPEMRKQIEAFEDHLSFLTQAYIQSLNSLNAQEDTIATRYKQQLSSQKEKISSLSGELQTAASQLKAAQDTIKKINGDNQKLQKQIDQLREQLQTQRDTTYGLASLNQNLKEENEQLKAESASRAKEYADARTIRQELEGDLKISEKKRLEAENNRKRSEQESAQKLSDMQKQCENEKNELTLRYESELQKKLREADAAHQKELKALRSDYEKAEKQYQDRLTDLFQLLVERSNIHTDKKTESEPEERSH